MKKQNTEEQLDEETLRKQQQLAELKLKAQQLYEKYGIQSLRDVVKTIDLEQENMSPTKTIIETAKEWFDVNEEDERLRFLGKTDLTRSDAEVIGAKGTAYIRLIRADVYQLLKEEYCRENGITLKEFEYLVKTGAAIPDMEPHTFDELDEFFWQEAKHMMEETPIIWDDASVGFMRGMVSKGRKGRYEYRDILVGPPQKDYKEESEKDRILKKIKNSLD
ncbi:MAG: hypothetical protein J7J52_01350 [Deltaproteobacteria bacterium]|nr:hypothetical protein [Deltaproteobacteria bacterium]